MAEEFTPPEIYSFPPFFTLQPVDATRDKQLSAWRDLIVSWHTAKRESTLVIVEWPLWSNDDISRKLSTEGIAAVMEYVVSSGYGEWADAAKTRCKIFYKTPQEWASLIHAWVMENALAGNVYTLYELHSGDVSTGQEFHGMDPTVVHRALLVLQLQGKAELIPGESLDDTGVKFFAT